MPNSPRMYFVRPVYAVMGVEELLDEVVARSVQNDAGPQAAGLQVRTCQDEAKANHVGGDNGQTIPAGSRVVAGGRYR